MFYIISVIAEQDLAWDFPLFQSGTPLNFLFILGSPFGNSHLILTTFGEYTYLGETYETLFYGLNLVFEAWLLNLISLYLEESGKDLASASIYLFFWIWSTL